MAVVLTAGTRTDGAGTAGWFTGLLAGRRFRVGVAAGVPCGGLVLGVPGGQRPEAGEFGVELVFGAVGASAFGGGERVGGAGLGLVMLAEGVAFAGGVGADVPGLGAGVCLGLAGAADLGVGAVLCLACGLGRGVALALAAGDGLLGGGDARGCFGAGGGDLAGGLRLGLGVAGSGDRRPGGCLGGVLGGPGGIQGLGEGAGFLACLGGLSLCGDGAGLGPLPGGLSLGQDDTHAGGVQAAGLGPGLADQRGGLAGQGLQRGERVTAGCGSRVAGGAIAGSVVVAAGAVLAAELPGTAQAGGRQRAAASGSLAYAGRAGGLAGHHGTFLSFLFPG